MLRKVQRSKAKIFLEQKINLKFKYVYIIKIF